LNSGFSLLLAFGKILSPDFEYCISQPDTRSRNQYSTLSFFPSKDLETDIINIFKEETQTVKSVNGIVPIMIFQPLGVNALAGMKERGGNAIGLDIDGPLTSKKQLASTYC
jgi:hypothetical protein